MKLVLFSAFLAFILLSCNNTPNRATGSNAKADWIGKDTSAWPQILLANLYQFKGRETGEGASAFLLDYANDTFACTAKHLLGEAMSIEPEVPVDSFNNLLQSWTMFPRTNRLSKDTINIKSLLNIKMDNEDLLLMDIASIKTNIQPLKPSFAPLKKGQKLKIIGCEYLDYNCHQKVYEATFVVMQENKIFIEAKTDFEAMGFSGAPVIDENGQVIGVLSGSASTKTGKELLSIQPIKPIEGYLKK